MFTRRRGINSARHARTPTSMCEPALEQILNCLTDEAVRLDRVHFQNQDKSYFNTPYKIENAGAAALAAVGLAASRGEEDFVNVDVRTASAALKQDRYLMTDGEPVTCWDELSGVYRCGDGRYVQAHCNFEHHRDGFVSYLGCKAARSEVSAAMLLQLDSFVLEEDLTKLGLCAAVVRTPEEWLQHPHSSFVKDLPLVSIERIDPDTGTITRVNDCSLGCDSYVDPTRLHVLDFSRIIAGPIAARTFADLGGKVTRVQASHLPFVTGAVMATGHGKRNVSWDLREEDKVTALRRELASGKVDVVVDAYRPGSLQTKGFGGAENVASLASQRGRGVVLLELSAYGTTDMPAKAPWAGKRGFDSLVQSATGMVYEHTQKASPQSSPPVHLPCQSLDYVTGYLGAAGALVALRRRAPDPRASFRVRVALSRTAEWIKQLGRKSAADLEAISRRSDCDLHSSSVQDLIVRSQTSDFGELSHLCVPFTMNQTKVSLGQGPSMLPGKEKTLWTSEE